MIRTIVRNHWHPVIDGGIYFRLLRACLLASLLVSSHLLAVTQQWRWFLVPLMLVLLCWITIGVGRGLDPELAAYPPSASTSVAVHEEQSRCGGDASDATRLICFGHPAELQKVVSVTNQFFEPFIIFCERLPLGLVDSVAAMSGIVAMMVGRNLLNLDTVQLSGLILISIVVVSFSSKLVYTVYRVSPGRLEVFRGTALGGFPKYCYFLSLRDAKITCRFDKRVLDVNLHEKPEALQRNATQEKRQSVSSLHINLQNMLFPHAFAEHVFRAALCTTEGPDLPIKDLLG